MHISSFSRLVVLAGLLAVHGRADTTLRGPVLGYVLDSRVQVIRPINGIPGATHLGSPVLLPFPVLRMAVSSASDFALAVSGGDVPALNLVRNLDGAAPVFAAIPGAMVRPDRLVLSVTNGAVALYSADSRSLQIVRGLPDNPAAGPQIDLSLLSGTVTALALDREALNLLVAVADGGNGGLYRISIPESGDASDVVRVEPRFLSYFGSPSAITLLNADRDAVLADVSANQLYLIRDFAGSPGVFLLAGERDGINGPLAVEASADSRRVFAVNALGSVAIVDVETQAVELKTGLDATPTRLDRLQSRSTFLMNELGDGPLLLLDNAGNADVYFVPAGRDN